MTPCSVSSATAGPRKMRPAARRAGPPVSAVASGQGEPPNVEPCEPRPSQTATRSQQRHAHAGFGGHLLCDRSSLHAPKGLPSSVSPFIRTTARGNHEASQTVQAFPPRWSLLRIALLIALGGTGYAATRLPRNSVTTIQVKDFSLLARDFKRGQIPAGPAGPVARPGRQDLPDPPGRPAHPEARTSSGRSSGRTAGSSRSPGASRSRPARSGQYILSFGSTVTGKAILTSGAYAGDPSDQRGETSRDHAAAGRRASTAILQLGDQCLGGDSQQRGNARGPRLLRRCRRLARRQALLLGEPPGSPRPPPPVRFADGRSAPGRECARAGLGEGGLRAPRDDRAGRCRRRRPGQGRARRPGSGDSAQVPREHLRRPTARGYRPLAASVEGGYWLARPAEEITVADVVRAVEGPIANVRGVGPEQVRYRGSAEPLRDVWIAVRANLRAVLEEVTIADLAAGAPAARRNAHERTGRLAGALTAPKPSRDRSSSAR